jgi:hypothetical protein
LNTLPSKENPDGTLESLAAASSCRRKNSLKILFMLNSTLPQWVQESHLPDSQNRSRHQSAHAFGAQ